MTGRSNRAFLEMLAAAKERLNGRDPYEIAAKANVTFLAEENAFQLTSLGRQLRLRRPDYDADPPIDQWLHLVLLHYLDLADGTPLGRQLLSFGQMKDGLVRGGGFDRTCEQVMAGFFAKKPLEKRRSLGGEIEPSNADLCAVLPLFPRYPVTLKLWLAEEDDIGGSGRLFADSSADHYLTIEDAVTVGDFILQTLRREYEKRDS